MTQIPKKETLIKTDFKSEQICNISVISVLFRSFKTQLLAF